MKLALVSIAAFLSYSLGGQSYVPFTLDTALRLSSETVVQTANQEQTDVKSKVQQLKSTSARERAEAACALGEAREISAISELVRILPDDTPVEQPVCRRDTNWGDKEVPKTTPGEMAAIALSQIGRPAVNALIEAMDHKAWHARSNAAFALGLIKDSRSVLPLVAATRDPEPQVRARAAWSLGLVGDERAVEPLTLILKDPEWKVRSQAAWALGLKGDERSVEGLIAALADSHAKVQSQAAWALGLRGDERAVGPLSLALTAPEEQVRSQAAWALGLKGDSRSVTPLIAALADDDARVRSQAAWALGLKGDGRAVEPLRAALNDHDERVRKQAAWALKMRRIMGGEKE
jgi:HEAT repeat protein